MSECVALSKCGDNFGMNTGYGRYGAAYNMVGLIYFNDNFRVFG